jgi:hypothetical protein
MNPRTRFYAKQDEAFTEAWRRTYLVFLGGFGLPSKDVSDIPTDIFGDPDYSLVINELAEQLADSRATQDAYNEPDTQGFEFSASVRRHYDKIMDEVRILRVHSVNHFIYHPQFAGDFQKRIGTCPPWKVKHLLEEFYSLQSPEKPNQLDGWKDYEYLADVLRASLADATYEDATFNKASLQIGVDWLLETARQLRPEELRPGKAEQLLVEVLKWQGNKAELAELGYALIEAKLIDVKEGERGAALTALGQFFGVELGKPESHLQTIQKRKSVGGNTPLLDRLKRAFEGFLERREK